MAETPRTVLIVDDDRSLRLLARATLAVERYRLLEAADGAEALAVARRERPDLVLLDIGLPGLDGYAVCEALKRDPATAGVPVVLLTARGQENDRQQGIRAGADAYVTKPFSPSSLLATIRDLLEAAR